MRRRRAQDVRELRGVQDAVLEERTRRRWVAVQRVRAVSREERRAEAEDALAKDGDGEEGEANPETTKIAEPAPAEKTSEVTNGTETNGTEAQATNAKVERDPAAPSE